MVKMKKSSTKDWEQFFYDTVAEMPNNKFEQSDPEPEREVSMTKTKIKEIADDILAGGDAEGLNKHAKKYGLLPRHIRMIADAVRKRIAEVNSE